MLGESNESKHALDDAKWYFKRIESVNESYGPSLVDREGDKAVTLEQSYVEGL